MKTIVINASPRKKWNTAEVMQAAQKGAESVGAETEFFNLSDLVFKGCRSCLICKQKDKTKGKCYWKDDLTEVIEKIFQSDTLLIGSPIYFGEPTSEFRALIERLIFCIMSYDDGSSYFRGKVNVGIFYSIISPKKHFQKNVRPFLKSTEDLFKMLNGEVIVYESYKGMVSKKKTEDEIKEIEKQFEMDLKNAFEIGAKLSKK